VQTPTTAPFSGTTGYNQIGYDTSLNPSGIDPILRATDGTMLGGHSPTSTPSGGDGDEVWSCTGRTDTSPACSSASLYFLEASYGGGAFVEGIEILGGLPTVVAPFNNGSSWPTPASGITFSHNDPTVFMAGSGEWRRSSNLQNHLGLGRDGRHSPTFTDSVFYDFAASCSALPCRFRPVELGD